MTRRREIPEGNWARLVHENVPSLNTAMLSDVAFEGFYDIPRIQATGTIPNKLFSYSNRHRWKPSDGCFHFYVEDIRFNNIWSKPNKTLDLFKRCETTLTPDFSVYMDWPFLMNAWNIYRARFIGAFWQSKGVDVIPSLQWSDPNVMGEILWQGLPKNSVVAISTGHCKEYDERLVFQSYYTAMLEALTPSMVLVYGAGFRGWLEKQETPVKRYSSELTQLYNERESVKNRILHNAATNH